MENVILVVLGFLCGMIVGRERVAGWAKAAWAAIRKPKDPPEPPLPGAPA